MSKLPGILILLFLTIFSINSTAQTISTIRGTVVNAEGELMFGNVILLSPQDSTIITGMNFLEGVFELSGLTNTSAFLKFTSLEFEDRYLIVDYNGSPIIDIGKVVVQNTIHQLDELVVSAERPLVTENPDGSLVVAVERTPLSTATSVTEILSRAPNIILDENNGINVFGRGTAIVYVDGRRVANERLSAIAPSNIEQIEIITNPGPRFDAEGNAVINIILKEQVDEGSRATLKNYYTYNAWAGDENRTNVDYGFSKNGWSVNSSYGLQVGNWRQILWTTRVRDETNDFFVSDLETDWQYDYNNFSNYSLGIQYDLNQDGYVSVEYTGAYEDLGGDQFSFNEIIEEQSSSYESEVAWDFLTRKNSINANYYQETDESGSNLFVGNQYSSFLEDFDNNIVETSLENNEEEVNFINNSGETDIYVWSSQIDYTKVLNSNLTLESGAKFWYVDVNADVGFFDVASNGGRTRDESLSSTFSYDEWVPAAYINLIGKINDSLSYSLGLRSEHTSYNLESSDGDGTTITDRYLNLFPHFSLNYQLSKNASTYFSYAARINRPAYESLNPFVVYQDEFTSIRGNPELVPSKVHAIELGAMLNDYSLKTGYNYVIDPEDGGAFQSEENPREYILTWLNLSREHTFFASLSRNVSLKGWQSNNTASMGITNLIDETQRFEVVSGEPYYYLYSQNSFNIWSWCKIYLTGWYQSRRQDGVSNIRDQASVNIGWEKTFFNESLKANLDYNDIFYQVRAAGDYRLGITDIVYERQFNTNFLRFSLSWNFGQLQKDHFKNKKVGESELNRAE